MRLLIRGAYTPSALPKPAVVLDIAGKLDQNRNLANMYSKDLIEENTDMTVTVKPNFGKTYSSSMKPEKVDIATHPELQDRDRKSPQTGATSRP